MEVNITYETLTDRAALMIFLSGVSLCLIENLRCLIMLLQRMGFFFLCPRMQCFQLICVSFSADEGFDMYRRPPIYKQGKHFMWRFIELINTISSNFFFFVNFRSVSYYHSVSKQIQVHLFLKQTPCQDTVTTS